MRIPAPRIPASLKFTVPFILLCFAATLSAVNLLYHVPQAERAAEEDASKRLAQEMSRLQSNLEYMLLKGDEAAAQHEIAVLAHSHDVTLAVMTNDQNEVVAATRRAWLGRQVSEVLPQFDLDLAAADIRQRRAGITTDAAGNELLGHAGILLGRDGEQLRPSRTGSVFLGYDLQRYKAEARAQVVQQSLYWAGWVAALALAMWLVFHFLLTRRTARLVDAAEQLAAGNLAARSRLHGHDELGRLGRAFDAMALEVAETQTRLRQDIAERARVLGELEKSEASYRAIFDAAEDAIFVHDVDTGAIVDVNLKACSTFGYTREEFRKIDVGTLGAGMRPYMQQDAMELIGRAAAGEEQHIEWHGRRKDGTLFWHEVFVKRVTIAGQERVLALARDITERKRADEALRISEASYRAIFDATEDAIFVHDIETGAIVDANPRACATFGYSLEELRNLELGMLGSGVHHNQQDTMALFARAVAGEELRIEWHSRSKTGVLRWHEVFAKRVTIGGRDRILTLGRDITARKAAEEALRASEEQYHAMFNASIDGLALCNAAGEIVYTNPALWRIYGYSDDDGESSTPPPGSWTRQSFGPGFLNSIGEGESHCQEVLTQRKDGSPMQVEVHGVPMQYQGQPHVLTITRDITEKKRVAEELARQRESLYQREKLVALGSLLAGVAHELNNPLSVVVARAVLLEEQGDWATQAAATKIRTAAERCARIVRTFLAMARQQRPERGPVAMNDVVSAALDITGYAVSTSSIEMTLDLADDIPPILADADQLHQVLLNLVINAQQCLQDHPAPRRIRVESRFDSAADIVRVKVADNGPGIPAHLRARIFEPFFTTKPTGVGTGVGLAVSLGIAEAHGGTLTVDCPIGGGAVFILELPTGCAEALADHPAPTWKPSPSRRTILIVDDEADIRDALSEILTGVQHRVVTASSGREALERMGAERYDAILTDIRMPDLDGRALFEEIGRRWPALVGRVVFVTGDTLTSGLRKFVSESGRPVIEKPFLPSEVRRVVAELSNGK